MVEPYHFPRLNLLTQTRTKRAVYGIGAKRWTDSALVELGRRRATDTDAGQSRDGRLVSLPAEMCPPPGEMASQLVAGRRSSQEGKSSAGQNEMTVRREHATATLVTERLRRSWGSPYASDLRFIRTSARFA